MQVIRDPEDLKIVFSSEEAFEKTVINKIFFESGLITDGGDIYKKTRKALSPLFNVARFRQITPIINEKMDDFFKLYEKIHKDDVVDFNEIASYFTLNSTLCTIFNINITDYDTLTKAVYTFREMMALNATRMMNPLMVRKSAHYFKSQLDHSF